MTPEEMNQTVASGLVYKLRDRDSEAGAVSVESGGVDANAELAGSASTFIEIPDFNRAGIALSSVQLYDSDAKRNEELTRTGVIGAGSP